MRTRLLVLLVSLSLACSPTDKEAGGDGGGGKADDPDGSVDGGTEPDRPDAGRVERLGRVTGTGTDGLNLRAAPSVDAEVLAVMPEGTLVAIAAGPDDGWYFVRHGELDGYCSADFLIELEPGGGLLNLLPWTAEIAFEVTQGHNGGSHTDLSAWAWDFGMPIGTAVLAAHRGTVRARLAGSTVSCCAIECAGGANFVVLDRGDGIESAYWHLDEVDVALGEEVERGDRIGTSGQSGWSCGPHLHFQMQEQPVNGAAYGQSVPEVFHDIGEPFDPVPGSFPVSKNGVLEVP